MAIKGHNFSPLSKNLLVLHQQARYVVKHEMILANSRKARKWEPQETHNMEGKPFQDYTYANLNNFEVTKKNKKKDLRDAE